MTESPMYHDTVGLISELARNPIVELVLAFALIEKLQDRGVFGSLQATLMEAGVTGIISAQQIAPLLPSLISAGGDAAGAVTKLLPMLAAA